MVKLFVEFIKSTTGAIEKDIEEKEEGTAQKIVNAIVQRFKDGNINLPVCQRSFRR